MAGRTDSPVLHGSLPKEKFRLFTGLHAFHQHFQIQTPAKRNDRVRDGFAIRVTGNIPGNIPDKGRIDFQTNSGAISCFRS